MSKTTEICLDLLYPFAKEAQLKISGKNCSLIEIYNSAIEIKSAFMSLQ